MNLGAVHIFENRSVIGFDATAEETGRAEDVVDFLSERAYTLSLADTPPSLSKMALHLTVDPPIKQADYEALDSFCCATFDDDLPSALKPPIEHKSSADKAVWTLVQDSIA